MQLYNAEYAISSHKKKSPNSNMMAVWPVWISWDFFGPQILKTESQ